MTRKIRPRLWQPTYLLNRELIRSLRRLVARHFPLESGFRILDVGCGRAPYRELFAGRCRAYVGCDFDPRSAASVACPAEELAFADDSVEAVVCFQVLEHVEAPWRVVEECGRVLRPGGILLVTTPFLFPYHASPKDRYRFTHEGLSELADRAGLEVVEIEGQCASLPTLVLLLNWYLLAVYGKLRQGFLRPFAGLFLLGVTAPLNVFGLLLRGLPLGHRANRGNTGFANYAMVARKPS